MSDDAPLPAGVLSDWLGGMRRALLAAGESDVPCAGCTACCTSSQFVHIEPDEVETLARIPPALLFPAPRMPRGNVILGYDEHGHCPMLIDGGCSIYEHRPRTCRTYDCRAFTATGIEIEDEAQAAIRRRAARWEFDVRTELDEIEHHALRAAARFVRDHADLLPPETVPVNATQRAVLAIRLSEEFRPDDRTTPSRGA